MGAEGAELRIFVVSELTRNETMTVHDPSYNDPFSSSYILYFLADPPLLLSRGTLSVKEEATFNCTSREWGRQLVRSSAP